MPPAPTRRSTMNVRPTRRGSDATAAPMPQLHASGSDSPTTPQLRHSNAASSSHPTTCELRSPVSSHAAATASAPSQTPAAALVNVVTSQGSRRSKRRSPRQRPNTMIAAIVPSRRFRGAATSTPFADSQSQSLCGRRRRKAGSEKSSGVVIWPSIAIRAVSGPSAPVPLEGSTKSPLRVGTRICTAPAPRPRRNSRRNTTLTSLGPRATRTRSSAAANRSRWSTACRKPP